MYRKRLKNVYDLLEAGNNKKVIQEVDKLITSASGSNAKKVNKLASNEVGVAGYDELTTLIIAKALKCLALVRTGRKTDSDKLIEELLNSNTTDENALSIIMQYCKETQQMSKIVTFYENAVNKCKQDKTIQGTQEHEEILTSLFFAYVRNRDFSKQQQSALQIYKQTNKIMFCYWNAASYVLMASQNTLSQQQKEMYLQLAEKILQKIYDDNKMEFNGEFLLYLNILESRKKYSDALQIIEKFDQDKHLSKIGQPNFKFNKLILYNKELKNWTNLKGLCEGYLNELNSSNLDDWLIYVEYFNAVIQLAKEKKDSDLIDQVIKFLDDLFKKTENNEEIGKIQGPCLAQIEFLNQLFETKELDVKPDDHLNKLKSLFTYYINSFSSKPGFFYDLTKFDHLILKLNLIDFVLDLLKSLHDQNRPFKSIKSVYSCLSYWQLHRYFGKQSEMNSQDLNKLASQLEEFYLEALEFGKDLLPTAFQYADEFLLMAIHIRYNLYKNTTNKEEQLVENSILNIISNLKHALAYSPSNFQLKLVLFNLFSHLGAYDSLKKIYDSMEIKNIQHYSTANLLLFNNIRLGSLETSLPTYTSIDNFFTSGLFEMSSFMVNCYKYGTFLKAFEINSFINEIKNSLSIHLCLTNYMCIHFMLDQINLKETDETEAYLSNFKLLKDKIEQYSKEMSNSSNVVDENGLITLNEVNLVDHTDKIVFYNWDPSIEQDKLKENYNRQLKDQIKLLKLRTIIIRFIDSCFSIWIDEQSNQKFDIYKNELINFEYSHEPIEEKELKIYMTKTNYLAKFSQLNLNKLLNIFVNLSSDLGKYEEFLQNEAASQQSNLISYKNQIEKIFDSMKLFVNDQFESLNDSNFRIENIENILESFSAFVEMISYILLVFTSCLSGKFLKPIWTEKCKKSKKKKGLYLQYAQSIDLVFDIFDLTAQMIAFYLANLNTMQNVLAKADSCTQNVKSSFKKNEKNSIDLTEIASSFRKSIDELKKVYLAKLKFLAKFSSNSITKLPQIENLKI